MKYYIRLDDACEKRDLQKWDRMEILLNKYEIKPLVGIIPFCQDPMMDKYEYDPGFWDTALKWQENGWQIALHGYNHVCTTKEGGLNPVNPRSEFAGVPLDIQKKKIADGMKVFKEHGINTKVFFAPSHTFDGNTIEAIKACSNIRIISDTIAGSPYSRYGMTFIPQQSGTVRRLPFNTVTFCYHPNIMTDLSFEQLEGFIIRYRDRFKNFEAAESERHMSLVDHFLRFIYFARR